METVINDLQNALDEQEADENSEVIEVHKWVNQLQFAQGRKQQALDAVEAEIAAVESQLDEREDLETEIEAVREKLAECRSRIKDIETGAIKQFNDHLENWTCLSTSTFERIWLKRVERYVREGRRKVQQATFELHIVRSSELGTVYEDTVENLSKSEREVTGLVFALDDYLVHDVHETVPVPPPCWNPWRPLNPTVLPPSWSTLGTMRPSS